MKSMILLAIAISSFVACSSPSHIVSSWQDPDTAIKNPQIHKIVVAALIYDPTVRREVEDYMASLYPGMATPSYTIFGDKPLQNNEDQYDQMLKSQGYDGIVMIRQTNENVTQHYVPGQFPMYYHTWGGYWHHGWGASFYSPGTPGHIATDRTWSVQVTVFSIVEDKLIWSANTATTDPGGRFPLFQDVCNAARKQMKKDGFLN